MASHALGEAGSPYLTGVISDAFGSSLQNENSYCKFIDFIYTLTLQIHGFTD